MSSLNVHFIYRTENKLRRSENFLKVHDYLQMICEDSQLQGLKYYGGPEVECKCKGPDCKYNSKVRRFTEYNGEKKINKREKETKCRICKKEFRLDEVIDVQVS